MLFHKDSGIYLYLLIWCPNPELNQGHEDFQSSALPTELFGQMVPTAGVELATY
ncbi:hypothetical protein PE36_00769 [Moritella sp. PE36]|nr:hypothetical protein PE36_00769 [Moritella sp. PE36]